MITASDLRRRDHVTPLHDIRFLPHPASIQTLLDEVGMLQRSGLNEELFGKQLIQSPTRNNLLVSIEARYGQGWAREGTEPAWVSKLPRALRSHLRWGYSIESEDPLAIVGLPYTGANYLITEEGLVERVIRTFDLFRLAGIKQLGYLQDPTVTAVNAQTLPFPFHHTRYCHSLDVMVIATLIAHNNNLPSELTNTLRVAALTHDGLTPAGGDSVKALDPEAFDEDAHYGELLEREGVPELCSACGVDQSLLIATVQGRGMLGVLLDIADKIAYVARDTHEYLSHEEWHNWLIDCPEGYRSIAELVRTHPHVCDLWDTVFVDGRRVAVGDSNRLSNFLTLRALLFREFYCHPGARFQEQLIVQVLVRYLYETGRLTRDILLSINDAELEQYLDEVTGVPHVLGRFNDAEPRVEVFSSLEKARERENELVREGVLFTFSEDLSRIFETGTDFLVRRGNRVIPFHRALPRRAARIKRIAKIRDPIRLYYLRETAPLPTSLPSKLASHRASTLRKRK